MPYVHANYDIVNPEWLLDGSPSITPATPHRANYPRGEAGSDLSALTTQVMLSAAIPLYAGQTVTNLSFLSGATGAGTPTNWWFALYSSAATPALLSQSADQTTTAWAANTTKTLALGTPQVITATGVYYAAVMVKATTPPTLVGKSVFAAACDGILSGHKILAQTSGSGLTDTAPATITSATAVATVPIVYIT